MPFWAKNRGGGEIFYCFSVKTLYLFLQLPCVIIREFFLNLLIILFFHYLIICFCYFIICFYYFIICFYYFIICYYYLIICFCIYFSCIYKLGLVLNVDYLIFDQVKIDKFDKPDI